MTTLTKIGNSKGIRIPKTLIAQAHLENAQIEFEVVKNGLLIKPLFCSKRKNWKDDIENILAKNKNIKDEAILDEFLDDSDLDKYQ